MSFGRRRHDGGQSFLAFDVRVRALRQEHLHELLMTQERRGQQRRGPVLRAHLHVPAVFHQDFRHLRVTLHRSEEQRRRAGLVQISHLRAVLQEELDRLEMSAAGGRHQRRNIEFGFRPGIGPGFQKRIDDFGVAGARCDHKSGRLSSAFPRCHVRSLLDQKLGDVGPPLEARRHQERNRLVGLCVDIHPFVQEALERLEITVAHGLERGVRRFLRCDGL